MTLVVHTVRLVSAASRMVVPINNNRADVMLRQRPGKEASASAATEVSRPLDSDEQEKVLKTIAEEARSQTTFFTVSGSLGNIS